MHGANAAIHLIYCYSLLYSLLFPTAVTHVNWYIREYISWWQLMLVVWKENFCFFRREPVVGIGMVREWESVFQILQLLRLGDLNLSNIILNINISNFRVHFWHQLGVAASCSSSAIQFPKPDYSTRKFVVWILYAYGPGKMKRTGVSPLASFFPKVHALKTWK